MLWFHLKGISLQMASPFSLFFELATKGKEIFYYCENEITSAV
jgi:hypothetical protein